MNPSHEVPSLAAARLIRVLSSGGWTLATCESLTGGGLGAAVTAVAGASAVYRGGLIAYATDLKVSLAGVSTGFVAANGVVNERVAKEMALGAAWSCRADVGLATTGVAGPESQDGIAPGTVWLGLALPARWTERIRARRLDLVGDRGEIRMQTVAAALAWLTDCLGEPVSPATE